MLLATVLAAVLLAAVLAVTAGMGRERQRLAAADEAAAGPGRPGPLLDLLRRDLANADTFVPSADGQGVVLVGHGGLDPRTLAPTGRLTRVVYRVRPGPTAADGTGRTCLVREQRTLDDPARPDAWAEVVAVGVGKLRVGGSPADGPTEPNVDPDDPAATATSARDTPPAIAVPVSVHVRVEFDTGAVDQVLRLR